MNNGLQIFKNENFGNIRTIFDDEVWFVGRDIVDVLGYDLNGNSYTKYITRFVDEEDILKMKKSKLDLLGMTDIGRKGETFINESGLYSLIIHSPLPSAKAFKRWVTKEVLPQIRKTTQALEVVENTSLKSTLVYSKEGRPTTKSTLVANEFDKWHKHVLESIDNKINSKDKTIAEFSAMNFIETNYLSSNGQYYREYEMTEEGFNFIALGFTGEKADVYKIKYINEFSKMKKWIHDMYRARLVESVLPQDNKDRQFVYIIENKDNGVIKIGVATDPERRLKQLQTGSVSELEIVYQSYVCSNAFEIEKNTHHKFAEYHVRGEWYSVCKSEVIGYLENQRYVLKSEFVKHLSIIKKIEGLGE